MSVMHVELSTEQSDFVTECLQTRRFETPDHVIAAALDLLRTHLDDDAGKQAKLERKITQALDELSNDRIAPLDVELLISQHRQRPVREDMPRAENRVQAAASAVDDINLIWTTFARENPDAADNQVRKLADRCRRVSTMPGMGRPRTDLGERVQSVTAQRFIIYYLMQGLTLIVLRVQAADE